MPAAAAVPAWFYVALAASSLLGAGASAYAASKSGQPGAAPGVGIGGRGQPFSVPPDIFGKEATQSPTGERLSTSLLGGQQPVAQTQPVSPAMSPMAQMELSQKVNQLGRGK